MRNAVIPAQIITVEDRIAGNLTLAQIIILVFPLLVSMSIFVVIPPMMKFSAVKICFALCIVVLSLILAIRIKEKIVMQWLIVLLRYNLRPGYYLYNKNDLYQRSISLPKVKKQAYVPQNKHMGQKSKKTPFTISDHILFERLISNPAVSLKLKTTKKGGLTVAIDQISQ